MKHLFPTNRLLLLFTLLISLYGCMKTIPDDTPGNGTPTATPAGTPVSDMMTKTIGNSGGSLVSSDGKAELIIPSGALTENTDISIQAITNNAPNGAGYAYRFLPEGIKFIQPVTVKFHYTTDDLAVTLADLMGIAFQDSLGLWYRINNFTNDSSNKVISAPITHFSDWSRFDVMRITPANTSVRVNKTVSLDVFYVDAGQDNDELAPIYKKPATVKWSVNGIPNGNSSVGTIAGADNSAIFKAPEKVPANNPVAVSGDLPFKTKYHGKSFNDLQLVSSITIVDGERYLLEMKIIGTIAPLIYTDSVSMIVVINSDDAVVVSDISNTAPKCKPTTATIPPCTATWVPDGIGETNVTSVTGTITGSFGDPARDLFLTITNSGTVSPTFTQKCEGSDPETNGGIPFSGLPTMAFFTIVPGQNMYVQNTGDEIDRLTLLSE
jgi:hypothetical protein